MSSLHDILSIKSDSPRQLLGVELRKNDYLLLKELIRLRKELGLSQADIAERMRVSQPTVSAFEQLESDPKLSTIRRYAKALGAIVQHSVDLASEDVTSASSSNFTRAKWTAAPSMSFSETAMLSGHFAISAPREAHKTDFALGA